MIFDWKKALLGAVEVGIVAGLAQLTASGSVNEQALMAAGFTVVIMFLRDLQKRLTETQTTSSKSDKKFTTLFFKR